MLRNVLLVALGGAVGSGLRYWVSDAIAQHTYREAGTAAVNLIGSFLLGALVGWVSARGPATGFQLLVGVGALGGFTTFSTWMVQATGLIEGSRFSAAAVYVVGSLLLGLVAAAAGLTAGRWAA